MKKFPGIPVPQLVRHFIREFYKPSPDPGAVPEWIPPLDDDPEARLRTRLHEIKRSVMEEFADCDLNRRLPAWFERALEEPIRKMIVEEIEQAISEDLFIWGKLVHEARQEVFAGADPKGAMEKLVFKILPPERKGTSFLASIQLRTLKSVYLEMQMAIKEARAATGLTRRRLGADEARESEPWEDSAPSEIEKRMGAIFTKEEIRQVFSAGTPHALAAAMIASRVGRAGFANITGRTLRNRLDAILPILRR